MEYSYSKMNLKKGDIVEVNLEKQANVILLDHINYVKFKNQKNFFINYKNNFFFTKKKKTTQKIFKKKTTN